MMERYSVLIGKILPCRRMWSDLKQGSPDVPNGTVWPAEHKVRLDTDTFINAAEGGRRAPSCPAFFKPDSIVQETILWKIHQFSLHANN
ncbi:hypothetical protein MJ904_19320 [Massilia sp. MB5]|uniref:hypothetical protein n=1 Tax=Massilia sp. MB5 TaxID=2919578 RepID=UPI001F0F35A0|nr:hypothetical protein [Massilia sp. MB5]UMR29223.1 hypothetical protein MJ904_19320 [Massilia sp. MB5]